MASVEFVFQLPLDVITSILGQWLSLIEISKLDRSISHFQLRKKFLDIISSDATDYDGTEVGAFVETSFFGWLYYRNISVKVIKTGVQRPKGVLGFYLNDKEKVCCKVRQLDLSSGALLTDVDIPVLVSRCPLLEHFQLCEGSPKMNVFNSEVMEALTVHSKRLKIFELMNNRVVDKSNLHILLKGCPTLREVSFQFCYGVDDECLKLVGEHCKQLLRFTNRPNDNITDTGLTAIARNCSHLIGFYLFGCSAAVNEGIKEVGRHCPHLQEITLCATLITDDVLHSLAATCLQLRVLLIPSCHQITAEGVMAIAKGCKRLRSIDIRGCSKLTVHLVEKIENMRGRAIRCVRNE